MLSLTPILHSVHVSQNSTPPARSLLPQIPQLSAKRVPVGVRRTGSFYVTDGGQPLVTEFSVNTATPSATIIASHTFEGTFGRTDQAVGSTTSGDFLYILGGKAGLVDVIALKVPELPQKFNP